MPVTIDQPLPDFSAPATNGITFSPASQRGKIVVLYFYPKDNTPGCTTEAMNFRDQYDAFEAAGAVVFGISRDSLKSHENFKAKLEMPFELISDADEAVCNIFDTIKMKKMYGKDVRGIERSTFLIDTKGVLRKEWRGVKVPNHVDDVLAAVRAL
ncbi:peroxiredoxin [Ralstonia sp. NFACC01]|jgi:peroxiredoxin Q/BCP|uniref:peroxiredoxin n=1 Tax=Ralstonia sp. NFACC01 TaxID=1566294 RepID=UPI0008ED8007|nr:peroxiredoxin [Ralstonia sp. NFACC01]SFP30139.1 peroxiredoxin Q/BCP [Ralstonia sp. NFACC01]